jgi:leucine dehydrogenase
MTPEMTELLDNWDGLGVIVRYDRPTGTWIFVALHDVTMGPASGGCRIKTYPTPVDGLEDALRLAEGMTYKWASIGFPFGGGKSVLAIPGPITGGERVDLFKRFGYLLKSLRGAYYTGQDMGTTPEDIAIIGAMSNYAMGAPTDGTAPPDPGPYTALGVFEGIKAALRQSFGSDDLNGRSVLVQGVGGVGGPLARMVAEAGGDVAVTDLDAHRARELADELGGTAVPGESLLEMDTDVYAPCAVGATLNARSIPVLKCRIVAGSANNQLEVPEDADRLMERGILYTPDYVINAGGAMAFGLMTMGIRGTGEIRDHVRVIGTSLDEIFEEATRANASPRDAAATRAGRVLAEARAEQGLGTGLDR